MDSLIEKDFNAFELFSSLVEQNLLAKEMAIKCLRVSSLEGFEEAISAAQSTKAMICVSDVSDGYILLDNTPHTRRVKTIFLFARHPANDMVRRETAFANLRELFRQMMSVLLIQRTQIAHGNIYIDPRISFTEIPRYFFTGGACAYFQIAYDTYDDISFKSQQWSDGFKV